MCSLSKVFFDWGLLWTMLYHYPNAIPESLSSILLPSLLSSWPYLVRARQCIISYAAGTLKVCLISFSIHFSMILFNILIVYTE